MHPMPNCIGEPCQFVTDKHMKLISDDWLTCFVV